MTFPMKGSFQSLDESRHGFFHGGAWLFQEALWLKCWFVFIVTFCDEVERKDKECMQQVNRRTDQAHSTLLTHLL